VTVYRQLTITFQENGDVDYQFLRTSADGNLTRYLIAYPAEKVSVTGGENLCSDNFRSAITREGHVQLTWDRGPGGKRGIQYTKIGLLDVLQPEPLLLHYRESIRIKNERQPAGRIVSAGAERWRGPAGAAPLARDADAAPLAREADAAPLAREADAAPLAREADAAPLARDADAAPLGREAGAAPLGREAGAAPLGREAGAAPLTRDAGAAPLTRDADAAPLTRDAGAERWRGQPNVFLLKVHDRNQRLSAVEECSEAVFQCTSPGVIHTCQAFLRHEHGVPRLLCSEHTVRASQRIHLRPTELVGAQFMCAGVLSIDWILEVE
jgi:hypothetical protein